MMKLYMFKILIFGVFKKYINILKLILMQKHPDLGIQTWISQFVVKIECCKLSCNPNFQLVSMISDYRKLLKLKGKFFSDKCLDWYMHG